MMDAALQHEREPGLALPRSRFVAQHPWRWFFLIALLPVVIVSLPGFFPFSGYLHFLSFAYAVNLGFAVLAALIVAWGCDTGAKAEPRTLRRVGLFAVGLVVWFAPFVVLMNTPFAVLLFLPSAVSTSFAIASVYSPTASLRDLARPLYRVRATPSAWLVALLAWPALAGLAMAMTRAGLVPDTLPGSGSRHGEDDFLLQVLSAALLFSLPTAVAWYGFAARRLLLRLSPLATALIVGVLPWLCGFLPALIRFDSLTAFALRFLLSVAAVALVAVWIYARSCGSLLPVLAFLFVCNAVPLLLAPVDLALAPKDTVRWWLLGLEWLPAVVLVVQGRMWRRPRLEQQPAASSAERGNV